MAKKDNKNKKKTNKNTNTEAQPKQVKQTAPEAVRNNELAEILKKLPDAADPGLQSALFEKLKAAELISVRAIPENTNRPMMPMLITFTNAKGEQLIPLFTSLQEVQKAKIKGRLVMMVVHLQDIDKILRGSGGQLAGILLDPAGAAIHMPAVAVGALCGDPVPVYNGPVTYGEPAVYPTRMDMAVYDLCREMKEVSRVWLKEKRAAGKSFILVVESDAKKQELLDRIIETAAPHAKDVPVEAAWYNEKAEKEIVQGAFAMYDREIDL